MFEFKFSSVISISLILTYGKQRGRRIALEVKLWGKLLELERLLGIVKLAKLWAFIVIERIVDLDLSTSFRLIKTMFSTCQTQLNLSKEQSSWDKVLQLLMQLKR